MDKILVVGATGQLGTAVVKKLTAKGAKVRALIRSSASAARFEGLGAETVMADLLQPDSLTKACSGITTVVATANVAVPTRSTDTFKAVERDGYRSLIQSAKSAGVRRFVYTSAPLSKHEPLAPFLQYKRETERVLASSGMDYLIFRADIFMDVAFTMMGSAIPLRGAEAATVLRPFAFANRHFDRIKNSIESTHIAMIPGDGSTRHAFICIEDVAKFLELAALGGPTGIHEIGGPEMLTYLDIVSLYEKFHGVTLTVKRTPAWIFRTALSLMKPFTPAGANLMCLNYIAATENTTADVKKAADAFQIKLTSAESFLKSKIALAAAS